ncbi:MAG TPA: ABC transporter substrate-binding protein, partial [Chloroflexota bacterium]|nr:ABC transporter substrate-binding protein [Chloroflexota bacterium]
MGIWNSRISRVCALSVLLGAAMAPWASGASPRAARAAASDTIVMAYGSAPFSIDPAISYDYAGPAIMRTIYEPLVRMQGSSLTNLEGVLATSWSANAGKTVWTFHLRHGVVFHDGTPFNAAAVKFSIQRMEAINQAPAYVFAQFVSPNDVKTPDQYTVQLVLHASAPRLPYALASQYGSFMVSPTAIKAHQVKGDWAQKWIAAGHDAGSGAYSMGQYVPNQFISFDKFPRYWRGWSGHHVSHVVLQWVNSDTTRSEMIQRGDADIANYFTPQDMV